MQIALFDLDHTLIPFDSGMAWTQHLVARGVLPASAESRYLAFCHQYVAGTLDIHDMHRASLGPLLAFSRAEVEGWLDEFEAQIAPRLPAAMLDLVARHRRAGDVCVLVTATDRFIAEPFARRFGIAHVVATEAATVGGMPGGEWTGEIDGDPCFREHKVTRVARWIEQAGPHMPVTARPFPGRLDAFDRSWFYSDSASDLPLLCAVTNPVAVAPDPRLRAHALRVGWPIIDPTRE